MCLFIHCCAEFPPRLKGYLVIEQNYLIDHSLIYWSGAEVPGDAAPWTSLFELELGYVNRTVS